MATLRTTDENKAVMKFNDFENIEVGDIVKFNCFSIEGKYKFENIENTEKGTALIFKSNISEQDILEFKMLWERFNFQINTGNIEKI